MLRFINKTGFLGGDAVLLVSRQGSFPAMAKQTTVVKSLISRFQAAGYRLILVGDGYDECLKLHSFSDKEARRIAAEFVVSVDESYLTFEKKGIRFGMMIVLSCDPGEILANYTEPPSLAAEIEMLTDQFYDQWEDKKWTH